MTSDVLLARAVVGTRAVTQMPPPAACFTVASWPVAPKLLNGRDVFQFWRDMRATRKIIG